MNDTCRAGYTHYWVKTLPVWAENGGLVMWLSIIAMVFSSILLFGGVFALLRWLYSNVGAWMLLSGAVLFIVVRIVIAVAQSQTHYVLWPCSAG